MEQVAETDCCDCGQHDLMVLDLDAPSRRSRFRSLHLSDGFLLRILIDEGLWHRRGTILLLHFYTLFPSHHGTPYHRQKWISRLFSCSGLWVMVSSQDQEVRSGVAGSVSGWHRVRERRKPSGRIESTGNFFILCLTVSTPWTMRTKRTNRA